MYALPKLPYAENALEPLMSAATVATHYGKHHKRYVDNVNDLVAKHGFAADSMEGLVKLAESTGNRGLGNNAGQSWNHGFYWESMAPQPTGPAQGGLAQAISAFGGPEKLRDAFIAESVGHFASGWGWLIARSGKLEVISTHDAGCPITEAGVMPILTCDVWEHAYYLDFKNDRKSFLEQWWDKLANWRFAEAQFAAAQSGGQGWAYPKPS
ncbi:MAG: superoxide dismutase [Hyphomonadaceae bacterium]|nr:superoxide dismutase [Hyphomonadaceae bacterium]